MVSRQLQQRRMRVLLMGLTMALLLQVSLAWVASSSATTKPHNSGSSTAKYYTSPSSIAPEEAAKAAMQAVLSPTTKSLLESRQLPWSNDPERKTSFLEHWNWQFEFFQENLTNLKVQSLEHVDPAIRDLYYTTKEGESSSQCVYTISLESDEYRDIRMTYIHCSGMETFRCLSYPRNGDLPVQGMFVMKMGGCKNLSIMDYQPLPATNSATKEINAVYENELLALREQIPTMSQPMTHKHFDSEEERKYFSELPLLGRCNELEASVEEQQDFVQNLWKAQTEYMNTHVALTKKFSTTENQQSAEYVLQRHSDFDAHVSEKEPAGPFLKSVFGPELGSTIHHNVIFPLSGK